MADTKITQSEYWKEVTSIAKGVLEEAAVNRQGSDTSDLLHEAIDGHQWIIYTWAYPYVLIHSRSEDAFFDQMGATEATSYQQIMQLMAFYALYQDVAEEISELERAA